MEISIGFVCALGIGTVFLGLVCIVLLCKIIGLICDTDVSAQKPKEVKAAPPQAVAKTASVPAANKGEIVAAISAAIAEQLGTDVTGIKILSIKKI